MTLRWTLICVAAAASACSGPYPSAPSSDPPFSLVAVDPGLGETLSRGATVTVRLTLAPASAGHLTLSIRDQAGARLLASEPSAELLPPHETSIQASFAVPTMASSIDVLADFRPTAEADPPALFRIGYAVQ